MPSLYSPPVETVDFWIRKIADRVEGPVTTFAELRCGDGAYTGDLALLLNAHGTGVAESPEALAAAQARASPFADFVLGSEEATPLADGECDFLLLRTIAPGVDLAKLAAECRRVLAPGRLFALTTPTLDGNPRAQMGGVFPGYRGAMIGRMPTWEALRAAFTGAGFSESAHFIVSQPVTVAWAYPDALAALRADPLFARMDEARFEEGVAKLRAEAPGDAAGMRIVVPVDLFLWRSAAA
jgi:SAM-dependent methyltransferase